MNRIILATQILGALLFVIVASAIADAAGKGSYQQRDRRKMMGNPKIGEATVIFHLRAVRVPGKIEYPNLTARAGRQAIRLPLEWTPDLAPFLSLAIRGVNLDGRRIVLQAGQKLFELQNPVVTAIEWPDAVAQNIPRELAEDKCLGLKMDTEVSDYLEGGVAAQSRRRPFQGSFEGEVIGIEGALFQKVHAFELPIIHGSRAAQNNRGSMKVDLSERAAQAAQWTPDRRKASPTAIYTQGVRVTLLDSARRTLLSASLRVRNVKFLGFTSAEGRSMSFELFFDGFEMLEAGNLGQGG